MRLLTLAAAGAVLAASTAAGLAQSYSYTQRGESLAKSSDDYGLWEKQRYYKDPRLRGGSLQALSRRDRAPAHGYAWRRTIDPNSSDYSYRQKQNFRNGSLQALMRSDRAPAHGYAWRRTIDPNSSDYGYRMKRGY